MKTIFKIKLKHNTIISSMLIAITILTGLIFSFTAFAEEGSKTTLTVAPMSQKIVLIPGEIYEGTIKVINNANATSEMTYSVTVGPYTPTSANGKDSYGGLDVVTKTNHNIMVDWTSVDKHDGVLNPNETTVLTYRIKVPKDAPAGAQYISILVADTTPTESNVSNGTAIESKVQLASSV